MHAKTNIPEKALILAGGEGTRMRSLTSDEIPKALLPFKGRTIIEHLFDFFKKNNVKNIFLSVGYLKEKIKSKFGNGEKFGINIVYVEEKAPLGTAGPLKLASKYLDKSFIAVNGDNLFDFDLADMFAFHKKNNALITIALTKVDNLRGYGAVKLSGNKIIEFGEKKEKSGKGLINSGLYMMEPEVIKLIPPGKSSLEREIFPKVAEHGKLFGYCFSGQWADTGTVEKYNYYEEKWIGIK